MTDGKDRQSNDDTSVDDSVDVTVRVTDVNEPPVFGNSTYELEITENTAGDTDIGSPISAADPEDDTLTYSLAGADSGYFEVDDATGQISTGPETVFDHEAAVDADDDNVYEFVLRVSDGKDEAGGTDSAVDDTVAVKIEVTDENEPPSFDSQGVELEITENTRANTNIGEPIQASDPESDALTYSLVGADSHWFEVDAPSGQLKTKALLDHESALDFDGDNRYEFRLWVTDLKDAEGNANAGVDDSIDVTVVVTNLNESPKFDTGAIELEIDENTATNTDIGDPVAAADPESDALTYSLAGADAQWFDIDGSSGQLRTASLLDFETPVDEDGDNVYEVTVQVSDGADEEGYSDTSVDDTVSVSITVAGVNEPPEFASESLSLVLVENSPANTNVGSPVSAIDPESDTLIYSLMGTDSGHFEIDSTTGQITVGATATFDIESPSDADADNVYEVTVRVTDGWDLSGNPDDSVDAEIVVKIRVTYVNEPPEFESAATDLEIAENLAPGANVGDPIVAADPESATLVYTLSGLDSGLFSIEPQTGQITVGAGTTLDYESPADADGDNVYELVVQVSDGHDEDGNVEGSVDAEITVTISVFDVNEPPKFEELYVRFDLEENTSSLANVGDPVLALDPESDDLTYSLAGDDAALFELDSSTGLLRVGEATVLDYETPADSNGDNVYELVVQVSDGRDEDDEDDWAIDDEVGVIVSVADVHEPGEAAFLAFQLTILENIPVNTEVGPPIQAEAPDGVELRYSLAGADAASFDIDASSGQISNRAELDFESPADANADNVYEIVVQVTDGEDAGGNDDPSLDDEIGVEVRVLDVNEAPEVVGARSGTGHWPSPTASTSSTFRLTSGTPTATT